MISPHTAMVKGLRITARIDVSRATVAPTSRSSSKGNDTTLFVSTRMKQKTDSISKND